MLSQLKGSALLANKYSKYYDELIKRAKERNWTRKSAQGYVEQHHITPTALGGSDSPDNKVFLTAKEHIVAHKLLWKFWPCPQTAYAAFAMGQDNGGRRCSSNVLASVRVAVAVAQSQRMKGEHHPLFGVGHSKESREKMSNTHKGKRLTKATKEKMKVARRGNACASKGVYFTPRGSGRSLEALAKLNAVSKTTVQQRCKRDADKSITSRSLKEFHGRTWRDLGWWFVRDSELL